MNEVTIMAVIAINTLLSKLYSKLAHIDLSAGVSISYADGCIIASISGNSHYLAQTDTPDAWCLDGRRNWRALKRLCEAVDQGRTLTIQELGKSLQRKPVVAPEPIQLAQQVEDVTIEPAAILGFPDDWQKVIPEGLMTKAEQKEALAGCPKKKGQPVAESALDGQSSDCDGGPIETPASASCSVVSLQSLFGSAKSASKRAPQSQRRNKRRPK